MLNSWKCLLVKMNGIFQFCIGNRLLRCYDIHSLVQNQFVVILQSMYLGLRLSLLYVAREAIDCHKSPLVRVMVLVHQSETMMKLTSKNILDTCGRSADTQIKGEHVSFGETAVEKTDYGNGSYYATTSNA